MRRFKKGIYFFILKGKSPLLTSAIGNLCKVSSLPALTLPFNLIDLLSDRFGGIWYTIGTLLTCRQYVPIPNGIAYCMT